MAVKKGQKRQFWSDEEQVSICAQTCAPEVSVAQVAWRYAMNANLIHKWLRDPKFVPDLKAAEKQTPSLASFQLRSLTVLCDRRTGPRVCDQCRIRPQRN